MPLQGEGVCNFVEIGGEHLTDSEALVTALGKLGVQSLSETYQSSQLFEADHVMAPKGMTISMLQAHQIANSTAVAILYGAVGSPGFKDLHDTLMQSAEHGRRSPACSASSPLCCGILKIPSSDAILSMLPFGH